jgi:N-acyl-D-amino-acid deacylase
VRTIAAPTGAEVAEMARLTEQALAAGALGFSTSRTFVHRSRSGENIGTLEAGEAELLGIAAAMRKAGKGVFQLISDAYLTADDAFADRELDLITAMAPAPRPPNELHRAADRRSAGPVPPHLRPGRRHGGRRAGREGAGRTAPDRRDPGAGGDAEPLPVLPGMAAHRPLPLAGRVAELRKPEVRAILLEQHAETRPEGFGTMIAHGFSRMFRVSDPVDYEPSEDRSVAAEAQRAGLSPAEYMLDLLTEEEGHRLLYMPLINYARGSLDDVHAMLTAPNTLYGLSDGGAHCGTICDASFPTSTLAIWARGNKAGRAIPLEALVHGLTSATLPMSAGSTAGSWRPAIAPISTSSISMRSRCRRRS